MQPPGECLHFLSGVACYDDVGLCEAPGYYRIGGNDSVLLESYSFKYCCSQSYPGVFAYMNVGCVVDSTTIVPKDGVVICAVYFNRVREQAVFLNDYRGLL